jgi:peptidoglycan-N-acetylglucosamine deacetylase
MSAHMSIRQLVRRGLSICLPRRVYLTHGPRYSRAVCLTFDDGPHPELTPRLLDLLAALGVPATFFLIGREAEKYPDLVRRIAAEGHSIGNHSYSHPVRASLSRQEAHEEVYRGSRALESIIGKPVSLYRPPRGAITAGDLWRFWRSGLTTVLWNVDPKDYSMQSGVEVRSWFQRCPFASGDIVLFHDIHPHALSALPDLISEARSRELRFTTVEAWTR